VIYIKSNHKSDRTKLGVVNISIGHPNNNSTYNDSTTTLINRVAGRKRENTAEERVSVIENKRGVKAPKSL
jgi:hypothetical protein